MRAKFCCKFSESRHLVEAVTIPYDTFRTASDCSPAPARAWSCGTSLSWDTELGEAVDFLFCLEKKKVKNLVKSDWGQSENEKIKKSDIYSNWTG